jgi:hypothetical protein
MTRHVLCGNIRGVKCGTHGSGPISQRPSLWSHHAITTSAEITPQPNPYISRNHPKGVRETTQATINKKHSCRSGGVVQQHVPIRTSRCCPATSYRCCSHRTPAATCDTSSCIPTGNDTSPYCVWHSQRMPQFETRQCTELH